MGRGNERGGRDQFGRDGQDGRAREAATFAITGEEIRVGLGEGVDVALDLTAVATAVAAELRHARTPRQTEAALRADELLRAGAPVGIVPAEYTLIGSGATYPVVVVRVDGAEAVLDFTFGAEGGPLRAGCSCAPRGNGRVLCAHQVAGLVALDALGERLGMVAPLSRFVGGEEEPVGASSVPLVPFGEADLRTAVAEVRADLRTAADRAMLERAVALIRGGEPVRLERHRERHPDYPGRELHGVRGYVGGHTVVEVAGGGDALFACTCGELLDDHRCIHLLAVWIAMQVDLVRARRNEPALDRVGPAGSAHPTRQQRRAAERAARRRADGAA